MFGWWSEVSLDLAKPAKCMCGMTLGLEAYNVLLRCSSYLASAVVLYQADGTVLAAVPACFSAQDRCLSGQHTCNQDHGA